MSQPLEVMAFRKRLKSAGYVNIEIWQDNSYANRGRDLYNVRAVEPLAGQRVSVSLTPLRMSRAFKRQRGGRLSAAHSGSGAGIPSNTSPVSGAGIPSSASPSGTDTAQEVTRS